MPSRSGQMGRESGRDRRVGHGRGRVVLHEVRHGVLRVAHHGDGREVRDQVDHVVGDRGEGGLVHRVHLCLCLRVDHGGVLLARDEGLVEVVVEEARGGYGDLHGEVVGPSHRDRRHELVVGESVGRRCPQSPLHRARVVEEGARHGEAVVGARHEEGGDLICHHGEASDRRRDCPRQ